MDALKLEKLKSEIKKEIEQEYQEKIKKGQITIADDSNSKSSFQNEVREIAQNARAIK